MPDAKSILDKVNRYILDDTEINKAVEVMRSGFLSKPEGGPVVEELQKLMADAHQQRYAYAVNSGTSALHCAVSALELKEDDEVIIPALANIADYSVIIQEGAKPVFADIEPESFNVDPKSIKAKITPKTRAIIVVHMYGEPVKIDEIKKIADEHNLVLIEDCAQAGGARYKGRYVGSFGDISCFSTYQTKHIVCGEGGVVVTSDDKFIDIVSSVANNGIMREDLDAYDYERIGYNYQMTDIQAALAIGQFKKLDARNIERRDNVEKYKKLLSDLDLTFQKADPENENAYFYLAVLLPEHLADKRNLFLEEAKKMNTPIKKLYPLALTELTLTKNKVQQDCPIAQTLTKRIFNVYVNPGLDDEDIEFMAGVVRSAYQKVTS